MNLSGIDLNLLVALHALLAEGSVGRAAERLGRSQPAVSHSLRHLRHLFADPLLVRVGHKMLPTPKAEALRGPLREVIERATSLLGPSSFDSHTSNRRFRLMIPDLAASVILPGLVERISSEAPNVVLELVGWRGPETMTPEFAASLDLIVSWSEHSFPGFDRLGLYADRDALAFRRGHPAAGDLSHRKGFLAARHIAVIGAGERSDPIDDWLAKYKLERRVALVVATYVQALHVAAKTDLIAFAPGKTIAALALQLGLDRCDPPIDPGDDRQHLFYPRASVNDPASRWLRSMVVATTDAMPA